jgi:hypothetical protein
MGVFLSVHVLFVNNNTLKSVSLCLFSGRSDSTLRIIEAGDDEGEEVDDHIDELVKESSKDDWYMGDRSKVSVTGRSSSVHVSSEEDTNQFEDPF